MNKPIAAKKPTPSRVAKAVATAMRQSDWGRAPGLPDILSKSVWAGDPYGWAPRSPCTISLEHGLGEWLSAYSTDGIECLFALSSAAEKILGHPMYIERINDAVLAVILD